MNLLQFGSFKKQVNKALKENNNLRLEVFIEYEGWSDVTIDLSNEEDLKRIYDGMKYANKNGDKYRLINVIHEF